MVTKAAGRSLLPSNSELEVLNVLWSAGPATVRDVYERLERREEIGYTTVLRVMQRMLKKGLVSRHSAGRKHVYAAGHRRQNLIGRVTRNFVDRVFLGSSSDLVLKALEHERLTAEEIDEIRRLLDSMKGR